MPLSPLMAMPMSDVDASLPAHGHAYPRRRCVSPAHGRAHDAGGVVRLFKDRYRDEREYVRRTSLHESRARHALHPKRAIAPERMGVSEASSTVRGG
jgi:hypothetical protein